MLPPTGTCDCLSFSCQDELPGSHLSVSEWVADLGSQRFPVPGGLHDTTPTSAFCHLSRSMEIERTTSGCWVSQRASRQSLEKEGCRLAPHLSQTLALGQSSWTGRGARTWSTHPLSRPRNFCQVRYVLQPLTALLILQSRGFGVLVVLFLIKMSRQAMWSPGSRSLLAPLDLQAQGS